MSRSSSELTEVDVATAVKGVHRTYPTGVTVVTTSVDGQPVGLALNAFSSLSMEPPSVLVCVNASALTHEHLVGATHFAVNVLADDQEDVARTFAVSGGDKFARIAWHSGLQGSPVIDGCVAHLELAIEQRLTAYTHTIFVGRVTAAETAADKSPLLYLGGAYASLAGVQPVGSRT